MSLALESWFWRLLVARNLSTAGTNLRISFLNSCTCSGLDMVDVSMGGSGLIRVEDQEDEVVMMRCIKVGLLCTQLDPDHRPTMHSVLKLLEGEVSDVEGDLYLL